MKFNIFKRKEKEIDYGRMPDYRHIFCYPDDQIDLFAAVNPNFTIRELVRLMNRTHYLRDLGVDFHYVGTRIFITGLGFDDEYPEYDHEANR